MLQRWLLSSAAEALYKLYSCTVVQLPSGEGIAQLKDSLEFTELEAEISSAKMPDILAHTCILGQIGANMPVILKYPQIFLTRTKKVKKGADMPVRKGFQPRS